MFTTLPFIVCLYWVVFLLLEWKRVPHATHMLTLFAAVSALLYLCHALYFNGLSEIGKYADILYAFCNIAVFPIYYLYICRLTQVGRITRCQWLVLIPSVVIGIWTAFNFFLFPNNETVESCREWTAKAIFVIQLVLVTYYGWKKIQAFDRRIMEFYSDTENRTANMTRHIIFIMSLCSLISVVFSCIGREYFMDKNLSIYIPSLIFSICLYAVCYIGYRQAFTADDLAKDESIPDSSIDVPVTAAATRQTTETLSNTPSNSEFERVCRLIEDNRWYLRADLRLPELALLVGIGRTRLSILINENSGMSFSDFINRYRIHYACRLLTESASNKDIVLAAIGVQSGFMSDSPFYRSFRKFTGMTPAQYRKNVQRI